MPKKHNLEDFKKKSDLIHNKKFDYSLTIYHNNYTKVKIICPTHGIFEQTPLSHLKGSDCIKCYHDDMKKTTEEFIKNSLIIHGSKYDYSNVKYINNNTKVEIICPTHGIFKQTPSNHLNKNGCSQCNTENKRNKDYIEKCKIKFKNKYDYSLVKYINNKSNVEIICPTHGIFKQTLKDHLRSNGCPYCSGKKMNRDLFIEKSNIKHNNFYDYSLVEYFNAFKKIKIICPKHETFEQTPYTHLQGSGCPSCKSSKGEKNIISYLNKNNISYKYQHKFENCKNVGFLYFDFYIADKNICIEYNGLQHYESVKYFGGEKALESLKIRDDIKKEYCDKNDIKLIIISYNENIEQELEKIFNTTY